MLGNLFDVSSSSSKNGQSNKSNVSKQVGIISIRAESFLQCSVFAKCHDLVASFSVNNYRNFCH